MAQQGQMHAAAIDEFGGPITPRTLPIPQPGADEVLMHVEAAGIGVWDPFEIEGGFAEMMGTKPSFPYILGSEGAGTVEAVGAKVKTLKKGDRVYALALSNPKGGFYAEYAAVGAENVSAIPGNLSIEQASAMPIDAITAITGLEHVLGLKSGESILIFGASGGIGHMAVQFAKRMGARVFAIASGADGVALVKHLGVDAVVDGRRDDVIAAAKKFAPSGLDCALVTAGGAKTDEALQCLRDGGRVAYPNGVEPAPKTRGGIKAQSYDGSYTAQSIARINQLISQSPFDVHIARSFPLDEAAEALEQLDKHYLGKMIILPESG